MTPLFFKLLAPQAIIYEVEADEENFQLLQRNLEPEIKNNEVVAMHAAIAGGNTTLYSKRSTPKLQYQHFSFQDRIDC